jgi:hypothetical protein
MLIKTDKEMKRCEFICKGDHMTNNLHEHWSKNKHFYICRTFNEYLFYIEKPVDKILLITALSRGSYILINYCTLYQGDYILKTEIMLQYNVYRKIK